MVGTPPPVKHAQGVSISRRGPLEPHVYSVEDAEQEGGHQARRNMRMSIAEPAFKAINTRKY